MKLLHTKLPEFIRKMEVAAATAGERPKNYHLEGMENLKTGKLQSLKTGRIENAVEELARREDIDEIQLLVGRCGDRGREAEKLSCTHT